MSNKERDEKGQGHQPGTPSTFDRQLSSFMRPRSEGEFERTVDGIIRYATQESYDAYTLMQAVELGYRGISGDRRSRAGGRRILDEVEKYFEEGGIIMKTLLPSGTATPELARPALARLTQLIQGTEKNDRIIRLRNVAMLTIPSVQSFINEVKRRIPENPTDEQLTGKAIPVIVAATIIDQRTRLPRRLIEDPQYKEVQSTYNRVFQISRRVLHGDRNIPELVAMVAKSRADITVEGIPDIWTAKFGGVSLEDIANSEDRETARGLILDHAANLFHGDYLRQRYLEEVIFGDSFTRPNSGRVQRGISLSEKIFYFQKWFSEKTFGPALLRESKDIPVRPEYEEIAKLDPEFDEKLATLVAFADHSTLVQMARAIMTSSVYGGGVIRKFEPDLEEGDILREYPFGARANEEAQDEVESSTLFLLDTITRDYLRKYLPRIKENLLARWQAHTHSQSRNPLLRNVSPRNIHSLINYIETYLTADDERLNAEEILDRIEGNAGSNFMQNVQDDQEHLEHIAQQMWRDTRIHFWPDDLEFHTIRFPDRSPPNIVGFGAIQLAVGRDLETGVAFGIKFKETDIAITGKLDKDGNIHSLSIPLEQLHPGIYTFIRYLAVASFRAYVQEPETIIREVPTREGDSGIQEEPPVGGPEPTEGSGTSEVEPRERVLPRRRTIYVRSGASEQPQTRRSSGRRSSRISHPVIRHPRAVEGRARYEEVLQRYYTAPDEDKPPILFELDEARKYLTQPNRKKAEGYPPEFQLEQMAFPDPRTGKRLYREIWVSKHYSPRRAPEQQYEEDIQYRTTLDFLDETIIDLIVR